MADTEQDLKEWMDSRGVTAERMADALKVSPQTIKNWRSVGVPERRRAHVSYVISAWSDNPPAQSPLTQPLVINPTREQFRAWESAVRNSEFDHLEDWAIHGLDMLAAEWMANKQKTAEEARGKLAALPSARVAEEPDQAKTPAKK